MADWFGNPRKYTYIPRNNADWSAPLVLLYCLHTLGNHDQASGFCWLCLSVLSLKRPWWKSYIDGFSSPPRKHFSCRWCCSIYSSWCLPVDMPAPHGFITSFLWSMISFCFQRSFHSVSFSQFSEHFPSCLSQVTILAPPSCYGAVHSHFSSWRAASCPIAHGLPTPAAPWSARHFHPTGL